MSNAIVPFNDIERMALAVSKSNLFGMKTPEQAIALMLVAQSEGLHPARAAMEYHVIQGRPALKADAMLARFQNAGGKVEWKDYTDSKVTGIFSHPQGGTVTVEWSMSMAEKAGLTKNPTWRQYPRQMLRARCISEGIRTVYPGVSVGVYTPEEVQDFAPAERDVTPPAQETPRPVSPRQAVKEAAAKARPPVIEGTAERVTDDPTEGDLSGIGEPQKPDADTLAKVKAAFATIGLDAEDTYGKPMTEWTMQDLAESREVFKAMKIEAAKDAAAAGGDAI